VKGELYLSHRVLGEDFFFSLALESISNTESFKLDCYKRKNFKLHVSVDLATITTSSYLLANLIISPAPPPIIPYPAVL
jgi:hypothetical protein